eukprot:Nitzschia sp. Nitz4//scaffold28_size193895//28642//29952//NITZ4_001629-RA/size193895-augustus-gene-0.290-mRNA-1//1//CDS//3329545874//6988//frame0
MNAEEGALDHEMVEPTTIEQAVDEEAIASAVSEAAAEVAANVVQDSTGKEPDNTESDTKSPTKDTKKRVRRVGTVPARKAVKVEGAGIPPAGESVGGASSSAADTTAPASGHPEFLANPAANPGEGIPRVFSKHDEKWNSMFEKLQAFKNQHNTTMVPQCYDQDSRLGRWVHYQRVEYWIYQQTGAGKITPERIARLDALGFEWDPQRAQWNYMYEKLLQYKKEFGHCKVPKGYYKDLELANWVRNQRLERANMIKGKKSRMTTDRFLKLDSLGFRWSTSMPARAKNRKDPKAPETKEDVGTTNDLPGEKEDPKPEVDADSGNKAEPEPAATKPEDTVPDQEAAVAVTNGVEI